ncbi:uncharacterized protein LOC128475096 isoform X2 [Spea bombifrons]|uniref:uncharacterized protein LOC128475096 isoform X2 n=1 Tax=Spea bombifrons TaxID=233779 RepID=UPI002349AAD4|nr:uncharacterized protein LOC128475096 isoform X2 [Spea bombifrons]
MSSPLALETVEALLGAIGVWFIPVHSATADLLLLLTGRTATPPTTVTEPYPHMRQRTEAGGLDAHVTGVTLETAQDELTHSQDVSYSSPLRDTNSPSFDFTPRADTQNSPSDLELTSLHSAVVANTDKERVAETVLTTQHRTSLPHTFPTEHQSGAPDITTTAMEVNKDMCVPYSGLTDAEVLAVVIGVLFMTILLSALFYQFVVFMKKKKAIRNSSIYIIENELHKHDIEGNSFQPDTRL